MESNKVDMGSRSRMSVASMARHRCAIAPPYQMRRLVRGALPLVVFMRFVSIGLFVAMGNESDTHCFY